jgi:hypothetical protein
MRRKLIGLVLLALLTAAAVLVERLTRPDLVDDAGA